LTTQAGEGKGVCVYVVCVCVCVCVHDASGGTIQEIFLHEFCQFQQYIKGWFFLFSLFSSLRDPM